MDPLVEWDWADCIYFAVTILTGIGVLAIGWQIIGERNARHREFENMYVQRYWDISSRMPSRFVHGHVDYVPNNAERNALCDYLLLCEDELDLREQGFITDQTWHIWMSGIVFALRDPQLIKLAQGFPSERLDNFKALIEDPRIEFDPLKRTKLRRWWTGLS
ncbi:hypothetical protein GCM10025778_29600 [Paeniglutamicibacter antarcticus]|uniref:DUF4760 domain-containing protein n=1 Tax=Paeniglutamicibacter antarcticus TaxID=494023 RepID=A0ABP9TP09_9MICC